MARFKRELRTTCYEWVTNTTWHDLNVSHERHVMGESRTLHDTGPWRWHIAMICVCARYGNHTTWHDMSSEYRLFYRALLQKRHIILRSLLICFPWRWHIANHSYCVCTQYGNLACGEDSYDPLSCTSFSTKEPLNIGHFCGEWPIKIRDPMSLRHPVACVNDLHIALCQSPELRNSISFLHTRAFLSSSKCVTFFRACFTHIKHSHTYATIHIPHICNNTNTTDMQQHTNMFQTDTMPHTRALPLPRNVWYCLWLATYDKQRHTYASCICVLLHMCAVAYVCCCICVLHMINKRHTYATGRTPHIWNKTRTCFRHTPCHTLVLSLFLETWNIACGLLHTY